MGVLKKKLVQCGFHCKKSVDLCLVVARSFRFFWTVYITYSHIAGHIDTLSMCLLLAILQLEFVHPVVI